MINFNFRRAVLCSAVLGFCLALTSSSAWAVDPPTSQSLHARVLYQITKDPSNCVLTEGGTVLRCAHYITVELEWSRSNDYPVSPSTTSPYWSSIVIALSDTKFPLGYVVGNTSEYSGVDGLGGFQGQVTDDEAKAFVRGFTGDNFIIQSKYKMPDGTEYTLYSTPGESVDVLVDQDQALKQSLPNNNICRADPVYMHSGQFYYQCNDVSIPGRKLDLNLMHAYFGGSFYNGRFGYGWRLAHDMRLHELVNDDVVIVTGGGQKNRYTKSGSNYLAPAGRFETLVKNGNGTWTLTMAQGAQYQFNAEGRLTAIEDRNDNTIALAYGSTTTTFWGYSPYGQNPVAKIKIGVNKPLVSVTDTTGRQLDFNYNSDGLLGSIEEGAREWAFTYGSTTHDLLTITKPATTQFTSGVTKTFEYENHNVKKIKDGKGNYFVENTYDTDGRVTAQKLGETSGETMTFDYNTADQVTEFDRNGFKKVYGFNSTGNMTSKKDYTNLNLRSGEPDYFETLYTYNSDSLLISVKFPRGNGVKNTFDSSNSDRRARGNLLELRLKADTTASDNNTNDIYTTMTYESSFNQPDTITDPKGNVTSYTYDFELATNDPKYGTKGDLIKITYPTVSAGTPVTEFTYNSHGQVTEVIDPNGKITQYTYDATTGYLEVITQDSSGINAVTTISYDANGYPDVVLDPNGKDIDYDYDALGWLNQVTDPLEFVTKYTYDANGNVTKTEKQASATPTWQTTNFTYTRLNHVLTVTDSLSRVTTYAYDDNENLKTVTDNNSKVTTNVYDERNMLFTVTDDNSGVTRYDYDINGKLAKVIDAETNDTEYAYDLFDRLSETKYADNSTEGYSYDKNSNLNVLTRPNAATITHTYDALNRLTAKDYSDSTPDVNYSYDLGSRMLTADNSASEIDFGYDNLNRVDDVTQRVNSTNRTMSYVYDDGGRRERLVYPSSKEINYTYDDNSRLDLVKIASVNFADYDYDTLNRRSQKSLVYPTTDQGAVYSFDIGNQLTSIANKILPSTNIATYAYTSFDAVGNRTQVQRTYTTGSAASTNYTYNDIYELTGTSGAQSHSYTYDSVGNRDVADSVTYTPNSRNQYTQVGATTYTNSSNGNLTSDGTSTFGYDAENRLISFDTAGTSNDATYSYDALGRRVSKSVNGTATYFIYDGDDIIADYSSSSLLREYIHGGSVDEILAMQSGSNTYYYHYDGLGSVTEVTDDSGTIAENYTYDVFGTPSVTASLINNRYRFTGREYDEESGLYHYRARAYSPSIGRFMQRDPIGYVDSMNLFGYVNNSPNNFVDPQGLWLEQLISTEDMKAADSAAQQRFEQKSAELSTSPGCEGIATIRPSELDTFTQMSMGLGFMPALSVRAALTTRVFWSGGRDVAGKEAMNWATQSGAMTLEMTLTGRTLETIGKVLPPDVKSRLWQAASTNFAKGAQGAVHVFQNTEGVSIASTWAQVEYKILKEKGNEIIYHLVTP